MGKRVMVLWADDNSPNLGVRVLAQGARRLAELAWGSDAEILLQDFGGSNSGVSFGPRGIVRDIFARKGRIRGLIQDYDVILDTGAGDSFSDIYGPKRFLTMAYIQWLALSLGKPVVLTPQTIGPFNTRVGNAVARFLLPKYTQVMARDRRSVEVAGELGCVNVVAAPDLVFMLPRAVSAGVAHDVMLNVSGLLWESNPHVESELYQSWVRELVEKLDDSGRRVTLLAHVVDNESSDNDARAIQKLLSTLDVVCDVVIPEDLDQVRAAVMESRIVIGARMHACLNALSLGTPTIPWAYSRKFGPLLSAIGWDSVVDLRTCADPVRETLRFIEHLEGRDGRALALASSEQGEVASRRTVQSLRDLELTREG